LENKNGFPSLFLESEGVSWMDLSSL
jgi:hypothetical protein